MRDLEKKTCRVGLVQAEPVLFDKKASLDKALKYIDEASGNGAELIVFPELFIPVLFFFRDISRIVQAVLHHVRVFQDLLQRSVRHFLVAVAADRGADLFDLLVLKQSGLLQDPGRHLRAAAGVLNTVPGLICSDIVQISRAGGQFHILFPDHCQQDARLRDAEHVHIALVTKF